MPAGRFVKFHVKVGNPFTKVLLNVVVALNLNVALAFVVSSIRVISVNPKSQAVSPEITNTPLEPVTVNVYARLFCFPTIKLAMS